MAAIDLGRSGAFEVGDSAVVLATTNPDANKAPPAWAMNLRRLNRTIEAEKSLAKDVSMILQE